MIMDWIIIYPEALRQLKTTEQAGSPRKDSEPAGTMHMENPENSAWSLTVQASNAAKAAPAQMHGAAEIRILSF